MADDPLELRKLTPVEPPEGLWSGIAAGLDSEDAAASSDMPRAYRWHWGAGIAAAAVLLLAVTVWQPGVEPVPVASQLSRIERLQAVSAVMDGRLSQWRGGLVDAAQADVLARMERELVWLDADIEGDPDNAALWAERVVLQSEMMEQYLSGDWRADMMLTAY